MGGRVRRRPQTSAFESWRAARVVREPSPTGPHYTARLIRERDRRGRACHQLPEPAEAEGRAWADLPHVAFTTPTRGSGGSRSLLLTGRGAKPGEKHR
jgi:hypothetical protein